MNKLFHLFHQWFMFLMQSQTYHSYGSTIYIYIFPSWSSSTTSLNNLECYDVLPKVVVDFLIQFRRISIRVLQFDVQPENSSYRGTFVYWCPEIILESLCHRERQTWDCVNFLSFVFSKNWNKKKKSSCGKWTWDVQRHVGIVFKIHMCLLAPKRKLSI